MHPLPDQVSLPGFRPVPRTGVIYVSHRAAERGWRAGHPEWANLGQGAPETSELPGGRSRIGGVTLEESMHEYTPVAGHPLLCQRVADFYNSLFRKDKASKYTAANVCISGGGRSGLTRIAASLGGINMGHFIPDYTAYEELLTIFKAFHPIPIVLDEAENYRISPAELRDAIQRLGLGALLVSNPCNPTGQRAGAAELREWVAIAREEACTCIVDEFYSHYLYGDDPPGTIASAAAAVEDVETDPVLIIDGLTKNWRYPGWRVSWTVGPSVVIEQLASAGSFLDGGASHPLQAAAAELLDPQETTREAAAIQRCFRAKRDFMVSRLERMGIRVACPPAGAFYCWGDLRGLPESLRDCFAFFEAGLEESVITVPGVFFDVNPGRRRPHSRYAHLARFSFGPDLESVERGMDALERVIAKQR